MDVYYYSPCGAKLRSKPDVQRFLDAMIEGGSGLYLGVNIDDFDFRSLIILWRGTGTAAGVRRESPPPPPPPPPPLSLINDTVPDGTPVLKNFGDAGDFRGVVTSYDAARRWYNVRYSDGDAEDMDLRELFPAAVAARRGPSTHHHHHHHHHIHYPKSRRLISHRLFHQNHIIRHRLNPRNMTRA